MAEVVATFASVLTLATLVKEAIRRVKLVYRASEELKALQEQVEDFASLVKDIKDEQTQSVPPAIAAALHRATLTLGQLHNVIRSKVLCEQGSTARARRRAWARNRSNVFGLQDTLKENRLSLLVAISANNMSSLNMSAVTASIHNRRLVDIQHAVSTNNRVVHSQSIAINNIHHLLSSGSTFHNTGQTHQPDPAGPLELSPNFFPEAYTNMDRLPMSRLIVISSYQKEILDDCMINCYELFLINSSRQWCRISSTAEIYRSSVYWTAAQLSSREGRSSEEYGSMAGSAALPYTLQSRLHLLMAAEELVDGAHVTVSLSTGRDIQTRDSRYNPQRPSVLTGLSENFADAWGFIEDLGCARYMEREVIKVEVRRAPFLFLSCLNGRAVVEHVCASVVPSRQILYNIRVLHCMKGKEAFAPLAGVVVNYENKRIKSVLIECAEATRSLEQMAQVQGISWAKRESWARQFVEGVSQLHNNGFVAGLLYVYRSPVIIDAKDIQFQWFTSKFEMGRTGSGWYPPEFQHLEFGSPDTCEADCPDVTSKADIFEMGAVLWLLAENPSHTRNSLERREASHSDAIDLPPLPDDIPLYYREIISACRAREPNDRPAARILLEMFPPSHTAPDPRHVLHPNTDFFDRMPTSLIGVGYCDYCLIRPLPLPFFHCNVSERGDFDVCQRCYDRGYHCRDNSHLLVEMIDRNGVIAPGNYHSSQKDSGIREIVYL